MRKSKTKSLAKKKADKYFSEYIRRSRADSRGYCQCITCDNKLPWKQIHNGHFMGRRKLPTRFDEKNCAPQCPSCNTFNEGRQYRFGKWIDKEYGDGTADELLVKSNQIQKFTKSDYEEIAETYKNKVDEL